MDIESARDSPDMFIDHDSQQGQLKHAGLDADGVYSEAQKLLKHLDQKQIRNRRKAKSNKL